MAAQPVEHADLWAKAAGLWERECRFAGVDESDVRLVANLGFPLAIRNGLAVADAPAGVEGVRWLGEQYLSGLDRHVRSERGSFYTPGPLANALAERALKAALPHEGVIADPACGAGSLLGAAAERCVATLPAEDAVDLIVTRFRGTDLDPIAVHLCDLALRIALLPAWAATPDGSRPHVPQLASVGDGLAETAPAALVLANPPFGRCRLTADARRRHARALYGHAHWPSVFLHASIERLISAGSAAFVLPASFVGGAYYQRLREYLIETAPPHWLAFVTDRTGVFSGDVLQEAVLGLFVRGSGQGEVAVRKFDATVGSGHPDHVVSRSTWKGRRPWLVAREPADLPLVNAAAKRPHRLADYGWKVSTGPLVWNRHKDQLFTEPDERRLPVVWASDVRADGVHAEGARPGRFVQPRDGQGWLTLAHPAVLIQRTTAPEQPRRLIAGILDPATLARLGGRVVVENHLNVCAWDGRGPLTPDALHRYLMSDEADRLYRCMTGSVAVSAFELGELPLPSPAEIGLPDADEQAA